MKRFLKLPVLIFVVVWAVFAFLPITPRLRDESLKKGAVTCDDRGGCDKTYQEFYRPYGFPLSPFKLSYSNIPARCVPATGGSFKLTNCSFKRSIVLIPMGILAQLAELVVGVVIVARVTKRENSRD